VRPPGARPGTLGEAAEWLAERPKETGLFTDFDGTLSTVVAHPDDARPVPGAAPALHRLARRLGLVAVVSGRPAAFLAERLGVGDLHLYGLHGVEHVLSTGEIEIASAADQWRQAIAEASAAAHAAAIPGVDVEDKVLGLTLHWRNAPNPAASSGPAADLAERLARTNGLQLRGGRASVELVPPIGVDKGTIVSGWSNELRRLAFIGDDVGDLLAFRALDTLRAAGRAETLKIAVASDESPQRLLDSADVILQGPPSVLALLVGLSDRLG
jgi:trehalose 6-phosphate phosphatase